MTASIISNAAAMSALQVLRTTSAGLDDTRDQLSSGFRVSKASDNAAYWSIATTMRSDKLAMSAVSDSIGVGKGILDVTYNGMNEILGELTKIRSLAVTALSLSTPASATGNTNGNIYDPTYENSEVYRVDTEMMQHWKQIKTTVDSSSFSGINLLRNDSKSTSIETATVDLVTGYANGVVLTSKVHLKDTVMMNYGRSTSGFLEVTPNIGFVDQDFGIAGNPLTALDFNNNVYDNNFQLYHLLGMEQFAATVGPGERLDQYQLYIERVTKSIDAVTNGMSVVGALQKSIDASDNFNQAMQDTLAKGIGRLVDADMNQVTAKMKAQETQQQLSIQTLNIANQSPSLILSLFKG